MLDVGAMSPRLSKCVKLALHSIHSYSLPIRALILPRIFRANEYTFQCNIVHMDELEDMRFLWMRINSMDVLVRRLSIVSSRETT